MQKNNKNVFTDRYSTNKKTHHLAWEYQHKGNFKKFLSITHSPNNVSDEFGNHSVIKLDNNPNPLDKRNSYVVDYTYSDRDNNFKSVKKDYYTSKANKRIYKSVIDKYDRKK